MAEYNIQMNVFNQAEAGYNQLDPVSKAAIITYDNTTSGLTSTNAQGAIDELSQKQPTSTVICTISPVLSGVIVTLTSGVNVYSGVSNASGVAAINGISAIGLNYVVTFSNPDVSMTNPNVQIDYYGVYNIMASYSPPSTFTVRIDETNSNSRTCCEYQDDAVGMVKGSGAWDIKAIFNEIKPCVFRNGAVNYYLNPNNYNQKLDGSPSDLTGIDGDVMVEFPKFAYRIYRNGNYLYVSISNDPTVIAADSRFTYNAFSRNSLGDRNYMYVGAYHGFTIDNKLRSVSGRYPTTSQTIGTFRTQAQANGTGYQQFTFYQLNALQCLYIIKYGNLNSQQALGMGYVEGSAAKVSGDTNANGMYYGTASSTQSVKFAGIEDFWGNVSDWIDGLFSNASRNILTVFRGYNDTGSGYVNNGQATADLSGYISKTQGINSNTGFVIKTETGSITTYYSDCGHLFASSLPYFGGTWDDGSDAGAFRLYVISSVSSANATIGARLSFC